MLINLVLSSCSKIDELSPIPEITYKNFEIGQCSDTNLAIFTCGKLEFDFIDGDADLGVYNSVNADSTLPDSVRNGIFLNLFEKIGANTYRQVFLTEIYEYRILVDSTLNLEDTTYSYVYIDTFRIDTNNNYYQFPYDEKLDRVGQNKTVKGTVFLDILFDKQLPYDTMRFEFYIRDRALHKSNIEHTDDFALPENLFNVGGL